MRVGLVCPYSLDGISGLARVVETIARGLVARGHEAMVINPRAAARESGPERPFEIRYLSTRSPAGTRNLTVAASTVRHLLSKDRTLDLIHLHQPHPQTLGATFAARIRGVPVVLTLHGPSLHPAKPGTQRYHSLVNRWVLYLADVVTAVSDETLRSYGVRGKVIRNGVDTDAFAPDKEIRRSVRHALEFSEDDFVAVFVGRFTRTKGCFHLINALGRRGSDGIHLLVVGEVPSPEIEAVNVARAGYGACARGRGS